MDENKKQGLVKTKRQSQCTIFCDPCEFSENRLPRNNVVMKCYQLVRNEMKSSKEKISLCMSLRQKRLEEYKQFIKELQYHVLQKKMKIIAKTFHKFVAILKCYF